MDVKKLAFAFVVILSSCQQQHSSAKNDDVEMETQKVNVNFATSTLQKRFDTPKGFTRTTIDKNSFGEYLRNLPLKPFNSPVLYYNGSAKTKANVYISVVNLPIGNRNLHQCADAVMYLWANYLFKNKMYNDIQFKFLGDDNWHNFIKWIGNKPISNALFFEYMQQVFSAANTRSLFNQLHAVDAKDAKIGDVLIVTGNPYGHAICVVDECINTKTGKKLFMLAQSYMPAQETQILINPNNKSISPWYYLDENNGEIITPEWVFTTKNFRRF